MVILPVSAQHSKCQPLPCSLIQLFFSSNDSTVCSRHLRYQKCVPLLERTGIQWYNLYKKPFFVLTGPPNIKVVLLRVVIATMDKKCHIIIQPVAFLVFNKQIAAMKSEKSSTHRVFFQSEYPPILNDKLISPSQS